MRRLIFGLLILAVAIPALAQPAPATLTWLRYYEAQPGKERELGQLLVAASKPVLDQLIADKKVVAWGVVVPMSHTAETWTHAVFVTCADWAGYEALQVRSEAAMAKLSPSERSTFEGQMMAALKPRSLRDVVLRHLSQSPLPSAPPAAKPKYIGVETYVVKPGRQEDAVGLFNEWAKPVFSGISSIGPWGFSMQELVTTPGWTHMAWFFMTDIGAIDEINAATMALGPMKLKGYDVRMRDFSEPDKFQGQLLRIVYLAP